MSLQSAYEPHLQRKFSDTALCERNNAIEICSGIIFDFYTGLPHMVPPIWASVVQFIVCQLQCLLVIAEFYEWISLPPWWQWMASLIFSHTYRRRPHSVRISIALFTLAHKLVSNGFMFKLAHYVVYRKQFPKLIRDVYTAALNRFETGFKC